MTCHLDREVREEYIDSLYRKEYPHGSHLLVFVHGLAGNHNDLRIIRDYLSMTCCQDEEFLLCRSIEDNTLLPIPELGEKVAQEIVNYITSLATNILRIR